MFVMNLNQMMILILHHLNFLVSYLKIMEMKLLQIYLETQMLKTTAIVKEAVGVIMTMMEI